MVKKKVIITGKDQNLKPVKEEIEFQFEHPTFDSYRLMGDRVEIWYLGKEYVVPSEIINLIMQMKGKDHRMTMWNRIGG